MLIDSHAMLGKENHHSLEERELIRRMDLHKVDKAIVRPMGSELIVENKLGNNRVLANGSRLLALVSVNPWFGDSALDELKRCYDSGAVGLFLHPARQGFFPVEPIAIPVLELAFSFRWPVMFHTGTYIYSDLLAVGEVARAYPDQLIIAGFGGYADMWFELPDLFDEVENLYLDTSLLFSHNVISVISKIGSSRILFGSGEPRNNYAVHFEALKRHSLSKETISAIMGDNAKRIFNIK
ncbi:MAG: hypothetical protein DHS20C17_00830 [Cyclobacteriaceae bacterium]|nr:MAG: hypothetical protein DHS20C17_00830 [Cyclobacteriaceae bacterium]